MTPAIVLRLARLLSASMLTATLAGRAATRNIAVLPVSRLDVPWWHQRFDEKQRELRQGPVNLLWLGDSITQNWERDGPQPWARFAPAWRRFYGDRHAVNLGFKGDSTCHLLWRLRHGELDGLSPRGVILLIGANNFGHIHTDAAQTEAGIRVVLDEIHERLPRTHVLLLGVLPSIRSAWVTANTDRLDADLQRSIAIGRPYLTYQDVGALMMRNGRGDADAFLDPHLTPPDPPLHPTAQTETALAAAIAPTVARMLAAHVHPG